MDAPVGMRFEARLDASVFERRNARMLRNHRGTRDELVRRVGGRVQTTIEKDWPRDTNRSVRGFAMAHRDIGVQGVIVPAVRESAYTRQNLQRLVRQVRAAGRAVNKWARIEQLYVRANRTHQKYYRTILKELRFHTKRFNRATEELERFTRAVKEGGTPVVIGQGRKKYRRGVSTPTRIATVRSAVYGGEGRVRRSGDATVAEIRNKEPHVRIVERNRRIAATAVREATRGPGAKRLSRKRAVAMLAQGTTWRQGAAA
jgi:ribosomal protein L18E